MKTMARKLFLVIVLIGINKVIGDVCFDPESIERCDECIRCGYEWCSEEDNVGCANRPADNWCKDGREKPSNYSVVKTSGTVMKPAYVQQLLQVGIPAIQKFVYPYQGDKPQTNIMVSNANHARDLKIVNNTKCADNICTTEVKATVTPHVCSYTDQDTEVVYVLSVQNVSEKATVKYHVPCTCECSRKVQRSSDVCNTHGDLSCGLCTCDYMWSGDNCENLKEGFSTRVPIPKQIFSTPVPVPEIEPDQVQSSSTPAHLSSTQKPKVICPKKRGDVPQCMDQYSRGRDCYGNGYCSECDVCICYTDREGSQYFDNYCADLCVLVNECSDCLENTTMSHWQLRDEHYIEKLPYNETISKEIDDQGRKVWMRCNHTDSDCPIQYLAMRNDDNEIYIMIKSSCNDVATGALGGGSGLIGPIVGCILALIVVTAAAAFVIHKFAMGQPNMETNASMYHNIDAVDSQCQNPLYICPKSSYKNPMYGQAL